MTQKLTKKDKLTAIIATLKGESTDIAVDELVAYCENEIELLDKKAAKAKETAAKKKAENDELTDVITKAERAVKEEVSIPGKDGAKARKIAAYRLAD